MIGLCEGAKRAQSESIGVLLLTAVVVIFVGGFGVVYLGTAGQAGDTPPLFDADINATAEQVSITHLGGESLPFDDLEVLARLDGASDRYPLDGNHVMGGNGDDTFDPGETSALRHALGSGRMEVLVVHTASNSVIHHDYLDARNAGATTAAFDYDPRTSDPNETVSFDASKSTGLGGVETYEWDLTGDGTADATTTDSSVDHEFTSPGEHDVTLTIEDRRGVRDETTRSVTVTATSPTVESASLTDGDDDLVTTGDSVIVTASVGNDTYDVDSVTADASAFAAGAVSLSDEDEDGTYEGTFHVGDSPTEGEQGVTVEAVDTDGNVDVAEMGGVAVDTTPPEIETIIVTDESDLDTGFFYWEYVERYDVQWSVSDPHLEGTTVFVNRSGTTEANYAGPSGDETYENARPYQFGGRDHVVRVVAVDAAGNRACRTVTDEADGTDPPASAFESC